MEAYTPSTPKESGTSTPPPPGRKRKPLVIDLVKEENLSDAESKKREKMARLTKEADTLLVPLDHVGVFRALYSHVLTNRLLNISIIDRSAPIACLDKETDEFWVVARTQFPDGPSRGVYRFGSDWNLLDVPSSLQQGIYVGQELCDANYLDHSNQIIYVRNPLSIASCSAQSMLYIFARTVDVYTPSDDTIVNHPLAIVALSTKQDFKQVLPFAQWKPAGQESDTTGSIMLTTATEDGTLHICANSRSSGTVIYSFELNNGRLDPAAMYAARCLLPSESVGADPPVPPSSSDYQQQPKPARVLAKLSVGQLTLNAILPAYVGLVASVDTHKNDYHMTFTQQQEGAPDVAKLFSCTYQKGGTWSVIKYDESTTANPLERLQVAGDPVRLAAGRIVQGRWFFLLVREKLLAIESAPNSRDFVISKPSENPMRYITSSGEVRNEPLPSAMWIGTNGKRFIFTSQNGTQLYETIHLDSGDRIMIQFTNGIQKQKAPFAIRQLSWRYLAYISQHVPMVRQELDALASRINSYGITGFVDERDIMKGSLLYCTTMSEQYLSDVKLRLGGLMMLLARPQGRGVFFDGPSTRNNGPSPFFPYDGLEIEFIVTLKKPPIGGMGEAMVQFARALAYRLGYRRLNLSAVHAAVAFYIKLGLRTRYGEEFDAYLSTIDTQQNDRNVAIVISELKRFYEYGRWVAATVNSTMPLRANGPRKSDNKNEKEICSSCYPVRGDRDYVSMSCVVDSSAEATLLMIDPKKEMLPPEFYLPLEPNPYAQGVPYVPDVVSLADSVKDSLSISTREKQPTLDADVSLSKNADFF